MHTQARLQSTDKNIVKHGKIPNSPSINACRLVLIQMNGNIRLLTREQTLSGCGEDNITERITDIKSLCREEEFQHQK